jgi:RHS repeat-associated protein
VASSGSIVNSLRYTERDFDPETNLYFHRARYYDPSVGRFISEDPIRFKGGVNFYWYGDNAPVNWRDPSGRGPDAGTLANAWGYAVSALTWTQCAVTAAYAVSGLQTVLDGLANTNLRLTQQTPRTRRRYVT